jgi:hypothetical protein
MTDLCQAGKVLHMTLLNNVRFEGELLAKSQFVTGKCGQLFFLLPWRINEKTSP